MKSNEPEPRVTALHVLGLFLAVALSVEALPFAVGLLLDVCVLAGLTAP